VAEYVLLPERATLHGSFSRDLPPVLTIDSGDIINVRTLDARWNLEPHVAPGVPSRTFEPRDPVLDAGHALCGPVAVCGAAPGDTLEIEILELRTGTWGWTRSGGFNSDMNRRLGVDVQLTHWALWQLDMVTTRGCDQAGHAVQLRPFLGIIGMPPGDPGVHSTTPPRRCGGNMDCKELVAGSRLYLPIEVTGGLLSVGDGHAAQGDGEVSGTAIECPMELARLRLRIRDDIELDTPCAWTPAGWVTMAFHPDLDEAVATALAAMLSVIGRLYGVDRGEALALASVAVDLRITQIVNELRGVHAILPHGAVVQR
jgi:acetamidase/formamidase